MTTEQFAQMVSQYERLVYTVCYQLVRDVQQAEDLAQDTFISAWLHADSCPQSAQKPWLCRIAVNKAKDFLKSAAHRRVCVCNEGLDAEMNNTAEYSTPSAEAVLMEREGAANVYGAMAALAEPYRTVCVSYFLKDYSIETIAQRLHREKQTVYTQLYRGKKLLQKSLVCTAG